MADPTDGGTAPGTPPDPVAPVPPPGFAGGRPTPPPGFAGPGLGPALGQVPIPPERPTATTPSTASKGGGSGRLVLVIVVLLVVGAAAFFFVTSGGDDESADATTTTAPSAGAASTVPSAAKLTPDGPGVAFQAFAASVANGDSEQTCELLSSDSRDEIDRRGQECPAAMSAAGDAAPFPKGAKVVILGESIDDDRAEVSHQIGDAVAAKPAVLVKEDGRWKVALFAKPTGMGNAAGAQTQACAFERRTVETAIEAYVAQNGEYPPDAQALVGPLLSELPSNVAVGPDGTITMTGDCA